jgi:type VI secretion system protein ImpK
MSEPRLDRYPDAPPALEPTSHAAAPGLNPLVQAAGPVLMLAGHLRGTLAAPDVAGLRRLALDEIRRFEDRARAGGVPNDTVLAARYVLCAALDEAVLSTPWGGHGEWSQQTLLVALHRETWGGAKFFEMLDRIAQDPTRHLDLMELQYLCVAFGFAGKFQVNERGRAQLAEVQRGIYRRIRDQRGAPPQELSLRWEGVTDRRNPLIRYVPWWVAGAATLAIVLVGYIVYYGALAGEAGRVEAGIARIQIETPPLAPVPGALRLKPLLDGAPGITVVEEGGNTRVRLAAQGLFAPGSASLDPVYQTVLKPVAEALRRVPGGVRIEGHTDGQPLVPNRRFTSNAHLSAERARSVAAALSAMGVDHTRLKVVGLGYETPLPGTDARDPRNRRVEIVHVP